MTCRGSEYSVPSVTVKGGFVFNLPMYSLKIFDLELLVLQMSSWFKLPGKSLGRILEEDMSRKLYSIFIFFLVHLIFFFPLVLMEVLVALACWWVDARMEAAQRNERQCGRELRLTHTHLEKHSKRLRRHRGFWSLPFLMPIPRTIFTEWVIQESFKLGLCFSQKSALLIH